MIEKKNINNCHHIYSTIFSYKISGLHNMFKYAVIRECKLCGKQKLENTYIKPIIVRKNHKILVSKVKKLGRAA